MAPYFSLILPIYNVAAYLERCINSILVQNFKDYEIILVDDGSTDPSSQICDVYAEKYSNIRVIHKANGGLSSARNAGLEQAEGEYVWWIDSDDWIEAGALEQLYIATSKDMPDLVKFHYFRVDNESQEIRCNIAPGMHMGAAEIGKLFDSAVYTSGQYLLSAWVHLYRREFLTRTNIHFTSERVIGSEDYLFNLSVLPMAKSVCVLPISLYSYFLREGSLTQTYKKDLRERYEHLYEMLLQSYKQTGCLDQYRKDINFFYVWHLIRGTCITQEYQELQGHSLTVGRKNVKKMLRSDKVREALACCDMEKLSRKQRMVLLAMKLKSEFFFYYLFVMKPKVAN